MLPKTTACIFLESIFIISYPLKTWEAQVHGGVTTLEAHDNFARVIIAPEGLDVNFDWLPLSKNAAGNILGADMMPHTKSAQIKYTANDIKTVQLSFAISL